MAEEKKTEAVVEAVKEERETVSKSKTDYDSVVKEYQRVVAAYNRLLSLVANEYAEKVSRSIFEEIDKTAKK